VKTFTYNLITFVALSVTLLCVSYLGVRFFPVGAGDSDVLGARTGIDFGSEVLNVKFKEEIFYIPAGVLSLSHVEDSSEKTESGILSNLSNALGGNSKSAGELAFKSQMLLSHLRLLNSGRPLPSLDSGKINNCRYQNFDFELNTSELMQRVKTALEQNTELELSLSDIYLNSQEVSIVESCIAYNQLVTSIQENIKLQLNKEIDVYEFTSPVINSRQIDVAEAGLDYALGLLASSIDKQAESGNFEIVGEKVLLLEPYTHGMMLNQALSKANILNALRTGITTGEIVLVEKMTPGVLSLGLKVYDFTQLMSEGKTRIDTGRGVHPFGQYGVEEMHNKVVLPGKEFSFNKAIAPQPNGMTIGGRPISGGICNATTTLYRAALEAGFPITQRKSHGFYVKSYEWGEYPLNIIEATYWPNKVDIRFINDFEYPVLLRSEIRNTGEWQYHTIRVYSSAKAIKREVVFKNWKQWRVWSSTLFSASVERVVKEGAKTLRKDKIVTEYY
jgi:vancomycin resistance protein YoaR